MARTHIDLGVILAEQGRRAEAETEFRVAQALLEKLAAEHPDGWLIAGDLGTSYGNLGGLLWDAGDPAAARPWYAKAIAAWDRALALDGGARAPDCADGLSPWPAAATRRRPWPRRQNSPPRR